MIGAGDAVVFRGDLPTNRLLGRLRSKGRMNFKCLIFFYSSSPAEFFIFFALQALIFMELDIFFKVRIACRILFFGGGEGGGGRNFPTLLKNVMVHPLLTSS